MKYSVGVIIVSDRALAGKRDDGCLPVFESIFSKSEFEIVASAIVSDEPDEIDSKLREYVSNNYNLVFTAGGTGCSPRDNTPDVTKQLLDKPTPGLDEAIRTFSRDKARFAIFSRAVSGVAKNSYIVNLPGSPKAVTEILEFLLPLIKHPLKLIAGKVKDCQQELAQDD